MKYVKNVLQCAINGIYFITGTIALVFLGITIILYYAYYLLNDEQ